MAFFSSLFAKKCFLKGALLFFLPTLFFVFLLVRLVQWQDVGEERERGQQLVFSQLQEVEGEGEQEESLEKPENETDGVNKGQKEEQGSLADEKKAASSQRNSPWPELSLLVWNLHHYRPESVFAKEEKPLPKEAWSIPLKKEKDCQGLISFLKQHPADVFLFLEVWGEASGQDLQRRLAKEGLNYPYSYGFFPTPSSMGFWVSSRYPLLAGGQEKDKKDTKDKQESRQAEKGSLLRGILDVKVLPSDAPPCRLLGLHLKSSFGDREEAAFIRRKEARLARAYVEALLAENPDECLLVCGDFNDSPNSPTLKTLKGQFRAKNSLKPLKIKDENGTQWTHFYEAEGLYSQIDYVLLAQNKKFNSIAYQIKTCLWPTKVSAEFFSLSDHRALFLEIKRRSVE